MINERFLKEGEEEEGLIYERGGRRGEETGPPSSSSPFWTTAAAVVSWGWRKVDGGWLRREVGNWEEVEGPAVPSGDKCCKTYTRILF